MNSDLMKNKEVHENKNTDLQRNELDKISESGVITGKRKILIIEDNKLNQEMLRMILEDKYDIITAEDGEIGLEILQQKY